MAGETYVVTRAWVSASGHWVTFLSHGVERQVPAILPMVKGQRMILNHEQKACPAGQAARV